MTNRLEELDDIELAELAEGDGVPWVSIDYMRDEVGLDGSFTIEQLEAIIELKRRSMERAG